MGIIESIRKATSGKNFHRHKKPTGGDLELNTIDTLRKISPDLTVRHGPFKGIKYPEEVVLNYIKEPHAKLIPKILGCYEREIHSVLEEICSQHYSSIVNIGCAEGYYAVGLGKRLKGPSVFAYDIDDKIIGLCKRLAQVNNVSEKLITGISFDANVLHGILSSQKTLIFCDCEGCEKELFDEKMIRFLKHHDLLIELHDFIDSTISSTIRKRFESTHKIKSIQSLDDNMKPYSYCYSELDDFDFETKKLLLAEERPSIMEWFYMTPHKN